MDSPLLKNNITQILRPQTLLFIAHTNHFNMKAPRNAVITNGIKIHSTLIQVSRIRIAASFGYNSWSSQGKAP